MLFQFISVFLVTLGAINAQSCPGGYGIGEEGDPGAHNLHYDPEIWTFLFFSGTPTRQIYPSPVTNQWSGYYVDVINEVCKVAGKNCVLTAGEFENCWANNNPQVALMGRWADACVSYSHSSARARAVEFSHAFSPAPVPVLVTRRGNPRGVNPDNLSGLRIGFLRNWWADDFCLNSATGDRLGEDQIVFYDEDEDLVSIIAAADRGDVDAVFISNDLVDTVSGTLEVVRVFDSCLLGGESLMMRKDSLLKSWFDPALEKGLYTPVSTAKYAMISMTTVYTENFQEKQPLKSASLINHNYDLRRSRPFVWFFVHLTVLQAVFRKLGRARKAKVTMSIAKVPIILPMPFDLV